MTVSCLCSASEIQLEQPKRKVAEMFYFAMLPQDLVTLHGGACMYQCTVQYNHEYSTVQCGISVHNTHAHTLTTVTGDCYTFAKAAPAHSVIQMT